MASLYWSLGAFEGNYVCQLKADILLKADIFLVYRSFIIIEPTIQDGADSFEV